MLQREKKPSAYRVKPTKEFNFSPKTPYTKEINQHIPSGFCVYSKFAYGDVKNPLKLYRGNDCAEKFCDYIENEVKRLYHMFPMKPMKPLTYEQWREFNKATKCHIFFKKFQEFNPKVRDHCHYAGQYQGPAHRNCNLRYRIPSFISIVVHNLSGYDAHLFIRELGKKFGKGKIGVIAENKEKYISFDVDVVIDEYVDELGKVKEKKIQLRFIDSVRFMANNLDSLMNNLVKDGRKLSGFEYSEEQYELLIRKEVYHYEYMTSLNKFKETQLPLKEAFYSKLNMSDEDYEHA